MRGTGGPHPPQALPLGSHRPSPQQALPPVCPWRFALREPPGRVRRNLNSRYPATPQASTTSGPRSAQQPSHHPLLSPRLGKAAPSSLLLLFLPMPFFFFYSPSLHDRRPFGHLYQMLKNEHALWPGSRNFPMKKQSVDKDSCMLMFLTELFMKEENPPPKKNPKIV